MTTTISARRYCKTSFAPKEEVVTLGVSNRKDCFLFNGYEVNLPELLDNLETIGVEVTIKPEEDKFATFLA